MRFRISYRSALICGLMVSTIFVGKHAIAQTSTSETGATAQDETKSTAKNPTEATPAVEKPAPFLVKVAGENIQFTATGEWESVPPKSGMLEAEIKIPKTGEDEQDGRLTIMGAGGTIDANIVRWQGQFTQPDGSATTAKKTEQTIGDQKVNLVDISGTFLDAPGGPFSGQPKVELPNYRMLAAIIETSDHGNYFVKFYGPKATVDKNAAAFKSMIESLKIAE